MSLRKAARVILVGAPGVGKGTQSERLLERFPQLCAISSGDLLRHNVKNRTPLGKGLRPLGPPGSQRSGGGAKDGSGWGVGRWSSNHLPGLWMSKPGGPQSSKVSGLHARAAGEAAATTKSASPHKVDLSNI